MNIIIALAGTVLGAVSIWFAAIEKYDGAWGISMIGLSLILLALLKEL